MKEKPQIGQVVAWRSQSNGSWKTKTGRVIYSGERVFSPRNSLPLELRERLYAVKSRVMFDTVSDGVIVQVEGPSKRIRYYAPRLSSLVLA